MKINKIEDFRKHLALEIVSAVTRIIPGLSCQDGIFLRRIVIGVMAWGAIFTGLPSTTCAAEEQPKTTLTVGHVEIITHEIFSQEEVESARGLLAPLRRIMNGVHFTTREYVLRRELLFAEGDPFDPGTLAETERNLRDLGYLNNISITPVDTTAGGLVNIRVDTRESWSLQTNLAYTLSSSGDTRWTVQLSDKNFLGHGATLGAGVGADENSSFWNLWLRQRRLTSLDLQVGIDYAERADGHFYNVFVSRPFYAANDTWGSDVGAWDGQTDVRFFLSNGGPAGAGPGRNASLYARIPELSKGLLLSAMKRISAQESSRIWRLGAGLRITDQTLDLGPHPVKVLSDGRAADLSFLLEPGQPLAREQGTTVFPYLELTLLGREWERSRFIMQYGAVEDISLDLVASLRTGPTGPAMGSTTGFGGGTWLTELEISRWARLGPGFGIISGAGEWQAGSLENRYHRFSLNGGWVAHAGTENEPWITRVFAEYAQGENLLGSEALVLGLGRGLRTLDFDGMAGDRLARWNIEQGKVTPWEVMGLFRLGGAVFYSGGCAWWKDEDRSLADARHEVGLGLRLGPTRSAGTQVSRLDFSWALDGSRGPVFTATTRGFF